MAQTLDALTEKEKETLRLMVQAHDAKSIARELDLSVHTINERLRAARRKLGVTSSREAARILLESETQAPQKSVDKDLGGAPGAMPSDPSNHSDERQTGGRMTGRRYALQIGGLVMIALIALQLAVATMNRGNEDLQEPTESQRIAANDAAIEAKAREWLALVDAGKQEHTFAAAASSDSLATSSAARLEARKALGSLQRRELFKIDHVGTPEGDFYGLVFNSTFSEGGDMGELVVLKREGDDWQIFAYDFG